MTVTIPLVSVHQQTVRRGSPAKPKPASRYLSLARISTLIATWRARRRFRWDLEQIARDNQHLIDDIGLSRWQIEAEIAKRFWEE